MAQRRMFSAGVVHSAKFLRMPHTARLLYYDLGMTADDDGIAEAFSVMRLTGANEDDLRVLVSRGFVQVLNDDLVTYIIHWRENNKLRSDRKVDSRYKQLLLKVNPTAELLESRPRTDREKTDKDTGTTQGQPTVSQMPAQYSIVQDSVGQSRKEQFSPRAGEERGLLGGNRPRYPNSVFDL